MREICQSGSEGGGTEINRSFLPLSLLNGAARWRHCRDHLRAFNTD